MTPSPIDLEALAGAAPRREPYPHVVVPGLVPRAALAAIGADFPKIGHAGSFPLPTLGYGPAFGALVAALEGAKFRRLVGEKLGIDLEPYPTLVTVRGFLSGREGGIHTDTASKLVTVLLYLNETWSDDAGRLRVLRSAQNLDDFAAEIEPHGGNMLAFRVGERSWHGHLPATGARRAIQLNWVKSRGVVQREVWRHRLSALIKRVSGPREAA